MNGKTRWIAAISALLLMAATPGLADEEKKEEHKAEAQAFVHGSPEVPSEAWLLAAGGRIYDNWWEALDRPKPTGTHPSYPKAGKIEGADTWRCKECHGWDYRGRDGVYAKGSHFTGIIGIDGARGRPPERIAALLRARLHGYTAEMISDDELARIAAFVSRGQIDMAKYIDLSTRKIIAGDINRGREIFQTVCAACHGYDGKLRDWGSKEEPAYVGTEAAEVPDEVLNKILNAHPGVQMVNMRAFSADDAAAVLAYAATLPVK